MSYTNWGNNQPDNYENEDVGEFQQVGGKWNDLKISGARRALLEFNVPPDLTLLAVHANSIMGNTIHDSSGAGISMMTPGAGNAIRTNSISGNGGLGIDRGGDGVSPAGLPVITSVTPGFNTRIVGTTAQAGTLEFFGNLAADVTGYGEGERYLGSANVPAGSYDVLLPAATGANEVVTATLTDAAGNTTEFSQGRAAFTTVTGLTINNGAVQRSRVTSLEVRFNQTVSVTSAAFELKRTSDNALVSLTATLNGPVTTLSFLPGPLVNSGSLADGRYTLTVIAANVPAFSGGNVILSGIFRFFGDADGNGTVNASDFADFGNAFGTSVANSYFDFDNNGTINAADFAEFGNRFGLTL